MDSSNRARQAVSAGQQADGAQALRNIAIIAHVDHGKTTLVDRLLQQSGSMDARAAPLERVMDSDDLERERGITILSKTTAVTWQGYRINIVDTPGHADFGGEVERVLNMVDAVLLLVDAVEGPMPQTRFVTQKAFARGLNAIVVINKIDRPGARPDWVVNETFDLFDKLDANEEQLDFPVVYASALRGYANYDANTLGGDMAPLFQTIVDKVPPPSVDRDGPFQMQVSSLDYSSYVGAISIGRVERGSVRSNTPIVVVDRAGATRTARVLQVLRSEGLARVETEEAFAGDIIAVSGIEAPNISDTLCDPDAVEALAPLNVDEPTVSMDFLVNTSPLAGRDGKFLTSRQIRERLARELIHNVALGVENTGDPDRFLVSGRGELHLAILIENMRREGYELAISRPRVILKEIDGQLCEPFEQLTVDVEENHQGRVMELPDTEPWHDPVDGAELFKSLPATNQPFSVPAQWDRSLSNQVMFGGRFEPLFSVGIQKLTAFSLTDWVVRKRGDAILGERDANSLLCRFAAATMPARHDNAWKWRL